MSTKSFKTEQSLDKAASTALATAIQSSRKVDLKCKTKVNYYKANDVDKITTTLKLGTKK